MKREEVEAWIEERAKALDVRLQAGAAARIAERLGADLWAVENALAKLDAYADGEAIDLEVVDQLVMSVLDEKVWTLTDSVVVGDDRKAQASLQRLLADGEAPTKLAFMVAKQYRTLVLVKDLRERAARSDEVARAAGVPGFKLNAISGLAARYTWDQLRDAYRLLLESDLSVKRGVQDDESALQLLVHELCGLAPRRSARPAYAR
jgi:DNA polymerase-3 subunit delta